MAVSVQARGLKHQLRVTHRLLPRPFFHTFEDPVEARNYGEQLHALLQQGVVPAELLAKAARVDDPLLIEVVRAYEKAAPITDSDTALLGQMMDELACVRVGAMSYAWVDAYVRRLKARHLAPGTIRKRVGVLGRVLDWRIRATTLQGATPLANVMRLLPAGYSAYTRKEADALQLASVPVPRDVERDRRLAPGEEARIHAALAGQKRDDRERALAVDPAFALLFSLIINTGLRLREAYTLRVDQVDMQRGLIHVEGTKGHRGQVKPRTVPMTPALQAELWPHLRGRVGLLFPYWDGSRDGMKKATAKLSARFAVLFDYARVADLTEHDLRHEATCRWVTMRAKRGGWAFSDIEVCRIMGWTSTRMMLRYASLRGEDLAARLR